MLSDFPFLVAVFTCVKPTLQASLWLGQLLGIGVSENEGHPKLFPVTPLQPGLLQ